MAANVEYTEPLKTLWSVAASSSLPLLNASSEAGNRVVTCCY